MFGALLGLGASLIGGLLSKPKKKPTPPPPPKTVPLILAAPPKGPDIAGYINGVGDAPDPEIIKNGTQYGAIDFDRLIADSEAAGFNPLTVLRAGGAAGYQVTNIPFLSTNPAYVDWQTDLEAAITQHGIDTQFVRDQYDNYATNATNKWNAENENMRAEYNWRNNVQQVEWENDTANRQWLGGFVSGMGGSIASFAQSYNPTVMAQAEERRQLENALLVSEIQRNQRTGVTRFASPNVVTGGNLSTTWGTGNRNSYGADGLTPYGFEVQTPTKTNPLPGIWQPVDWLGDAENWETSNGEIASNVLGLAGFGINAINTGRYWGGRLINGVRDSVAGSGGLGGWISDAQTYYRDSAGNAVAPSMSAPAWATTPLINFGGASTPTHVQRRREQRAAN